MTDPLAIRIEAALRRLELNAYNANHWHPTPWSPAGLQIFDADDKLTAAGDSSTVDHFAAFDPSSVLRLITGMRQIANRHVPMHHLPGGYSPLIPYCSWCQERATEHGAVKGDPAGWPCPDVLSVASMLGLEEDTNG